MGNIWDFEKHFPNNMVNWGLINSALKPYRYEPFFSRGPCQNTAEASSGPQKPFPGQGFFFFPFIHALLVAQTANHREVLIFLFHSYCGIHDFWKVSDSFHCISLCQNNASKFSFQLQREISRNISDRTTDSVILYVFVGFLWQRSKHLENDLQAYVLLSFQRMYSVNSQ